MELHQFSMRMKSIDQLFGKPVLLTLAGQTLVANFLLLTPTIYMLQVYDRILISKNELSLLMISVGCLYLFVVLFLTELTRGRLLAKLGNRIEAFLGAHAIEKELSQEQSRNTASELKMMHALQEIKVFLNGAVASAILDIPFSPIYLVALYMLHPLLLLGAFLLILIQSGFAWVSYQQTAALYEQSQSHLKNETHAMRAYIRNFDVAISMGLVQRFELAWGRLHDVANHYATQSQSKANAYASASKGIRYLQQAVSLSLGAYLVMSDELSAGGMIAANVLTSRVLGPIDAVVTQWRSVRTARAAWARLSLLELDPSSPQKSDVMASKQYSIEPIYLQGEQELVFQKAQVTLVVGESGAGKSTLLETMLGVRDVTGAMGTWTFKANDANLIDISKIGGQNIGFLGQRIELFSESVASNIARLEAPDSQEVVAAAKLLDLHEVILSLSSGYQTEVSSVLPVGLRQRIALARAFYKSPELIVLDEPHVGLDSTGEKALVSAIENAKSRGATVVLAGHGSLLMGLADQLVVMKSNEVIACGPKAAVLASLGVSLFNEA